MRTPAVTVVKDGRVVLKKGYGSANLEHDVAVTSKTAFNILILFGFAAAISAQQASSNEREKELIKIPLNDYLQAHITDNPEFIRKAFSKDARIMIARGGRINSIGIDELAGLYNGKVADDEPQRKRWIESLDISGNVAIAKTILDYPTVRITDYMSLLKIDGEWKIVSKLPHIELKGNSKK